MKKLVTLAATAILGSALLLAGCGGTSTDKAADSNTKTVKIGATAVPHGELLSNVKEQLKKEGINLEIVEFTDYVKPNMALNDKELDANFFQHKPYLDKYNAEHKTELVSIGNVHVEPMAVYSKSLKDIKTVANGAKVAVPNDPSNGARALLILHKAGLITLNDPKNILSTVADIKENPHNLQFVELEAPQLPRSLDDVAFAVINTNYAMEANLNPVKDSLLIEDKDSPYANIVAVRKGDENKPELQKVLKALQSAETKKFIEEKYKGAILPAF